jgi:hypothetical protein
MQTHAARIKETRNKYKNLVKKPPSRPRRRWEDNIKMNVKETGCGNQRWKDYDTERWVLVQQC